MKNDDGLQVVTIKHGTMSWGYVIVDARGKVIARDSAGSAYVAPLIFKGSAQRAGDERLKRIRKANKKINKAVERAAKKRRSS